MKSPRFLSIYLFVSSYNLQRDYDITNFSYYYHFTYFFSNPLEIEIRFFVCECASEFVWMF